jgi:hypothetical protein
MLQFTKHYSTMEMEAELQNAAYNHAVETQVNPEATRYSDVKREFELQNFKLFGSYGTFVSITGNDKAVFSTLKDFAAYYANVGYYDPHRLGPFAQWAWKERPFIKRWLCDDKAAVVHQVINDPQKPYGLQQERQTTVDGYILPRDYNIAAKI